MTEKAAFIVREYVKHSLYDKVSTRPFLTILEKRWITFQVIEIDITVNIKMKVIRFFFASDFMRSASVSQAEDLPWRY